MTLNCETQTGFANDLNLQPGASRSGFAFSSIGELAGDNTTGKPSFDYAQGGEQISRDNRKWDSGELGSSGEVTFSYLSDAQADGGYGQLSEAQIATVANAMNLWSSVANINFVAADGGSGDNVSDDGELQFQGNDGGGGGWASWGLRGGGATDEMTGATVALGGAGLALALHEVGHAIGLSHPGDYNGGGSSYQSGAEFYQDTEQYSVMSYWSGENTGAVLGRYTNDENGQSVYMGGATGLGLYDIAAIQRVYGANQTTYADDTTYGFNSNTGDDGWSLTGKTDWIQAAIWDAGGNDTIDMSGYSENAEIDLREESFSSTGGLKHNLAIAKGAVIENAVGGSGDDTLQGNSVGNELSGGSGDDTLRGDGGDDTLTGGDGNDTALFSGNFVDYLISLVSDGIYSIADTVATGGKDIVSGIESFVFGDGTKSEEDIKLAVTDAPVDPVDPPVDPVDPPVDPVEPPVDPVDPPVDPVEPPVDPVDPPVDPVEPPVDPVDPPVDPVEPPVDPVDPVDPPVDPVEPTDTDDTLIFEPGKFNVLDGGDGNDTADFSGASSAVYLDLQWDGNEAATTGGENLYEGEWKDIADLNNIENLTGSSFDDFISGNAEDNVLTGGEGADIFDFLYKVGNDTITDYKDGEDLISIYMHPEVNSFDQLEIAQDGENTVVTVGSDTITLLDVEATMLDESDFAIC